MDIEVWQLYLGYGSVGTKGSPIIFLFLRLFFLGLGRLILLHLVAAFHFAKDVHVQVGHLA